MAMIYQAYNLLPKTEKMLLGRGDKPELPIKSLPELNSKIWGLHKKKLTIVGARTSVGKSAFALQLAWDMTIQYIPTVFLSLEMYEEDIIERLFCLDEKINNYDLLTGKMKNYESKWKTFCENMKDKPLVITDMLGKTWRDIDNYLQSLSTKPKVLIIDHLQEARSNFKNDKETVDDYLQNLRIMAIRNDMAVIICSQINRASQADGADSAPELHHLKQSGYIEESADIIMLLHWPGKKSVSGDKNKFIINVAKNRNGRTGWIEVKYRPENYWFYEELELEKQKK